MKLPRGWTAVLGGIVLALLAGCAGTQHAPAETMQRLKRVAVVSNVADVITRDYIGITVFGNEHHVHPIGDWRLDQAYEAQIGDVLRQSGLTVVDTRLDAAAFVGKLDAPAMPDAVRQACAANGLDGLFLLTKSGDKTKGIRVFADGRSRVQGPQLSTLYLLATLVLFDCASAQQAVAVREVTMGGRRGGGREPYRYLPDHWPMYGEWKPEVMTEVRAELVKLPAQPFEDTVTYILKGPDR